MINQINLGRKHTHKKKNKWALDKIIDIDEVFGGIESENFYQNLNTGTNNIKSASAAVYNFWGLNKDINRKELLLND